MYREIGGYKIMNESGKCKYCGVKLKPNHTICPLCSAKLPLVKKLKRICDQIKEGVKNDTKQND